MSNGAQRTVDEAEPKAGVTAAPIALIVLFALLIYGAAVYLNDHGGGFNAKVYQPYPNYAYVDNIQVVDPDEAFRRRGKRIFTTYCVACHMENGAGIPGQKPPLAGSEWVNNPSPHRIIRAVLYGLTGPVTVSGKPFNDTMVPWKGTLSDEDIAAVLTYVRQNKEWGNNAAPVSTEQVKAIHDKVGDRPSSFTGAELEKLPEDK